MLGSRWLGVLLLVVVLGAAVACGCLGTDTSPPAGVNETAANLSVATTHAPPPKVVKYGPAISAGGSHCLALCPNGTVVAWETANDGNAYGQCNIPPGLTNVTAIAAGWWHSTALLENGSVVAWGGTNWLEKVDVPVGLTNVTAISAGEGHNLALLGNGTVVVWGGRGFHDAHGLTNVMAISAGHLHSLALLRNGSVVAWGNNESGACDVPAGLTNVTAIAAGCGISAAALENGTVVTWGYHGISGPAVMYGPTDVKAIAAGLDVVSLRKDGSVVDGTTAPQVVPGMGHGVKAISVGGHCILGLFEDDRVLDYKPEGVARTFPSCRDQPAASRWILLKSPPAP